MNGALNWSHRWEYDPQLLWSDPKSNQLRRQAFWLASISLQAGCGIFDTKLFSPLPWNAKIFNKTSNHIKRKNQSHKISIKTSFNQLYWLIWNLTRFIAEENFKNLLLLMDSARRGLCHLQWDNKNSIQYMWTTFYGCIFNYFYVFDGSSFILCQMNELTPKSFWNALRTRPINWQRISICFTDCFFFLLYC